MKIIIEVLLDDAQVYRRGLENIVREELIVGCEGALNPYTNPRWPKDTVLDHEITATIEVDYASTELRIALSAFTTGQGFMRIDEFDDQFGALGPLLRERLVADEYVRYGTVPDGLWLTDKGRDFLNA